MAWSPRRCACRARMRAHVGRATARAAETVHGPARAASPAFRVKVRAKALAKPRRRGKDVKAAVARRDRLNNPDKLKSAVAATTRHSRRALTLRQVPRTTF